MTVRTAVHPARSAGRIDRIALIVEGVAARFAYPYGSPSMQAADWKQPEKHKTELVEQTAGNRAGFAVNWTPINILPRSIGMAGRRVHC